MLAGALIIVLVVGVAYSSATVPIRAKLSFKPIARGPGLEGGSRRVSDSVVCTCSLVCTGVTLSRYAHPDYQANVPRPYLGTWSKDECANATFALSYPHTGRSISLCTTRVRFKNSLVPGYGHTA